MPHKQTFSLPCGWEKGILLPFKMEGGARVDDTSVHQALREALANC